MTNRFESEIKRLTADVSSADVVDMNTMMFLMGALFYRMQKRKPIGRFTVDDELDACVQSEELRREGRRMEQR